MRLIFAAAITVLLVACGSASTVPGPDAAARPDAAMAADAAAATDVAATPGGDAAAALDAAPGTDAAGASDGPAPGMDAGGDASTTVPLAGFGTITGSCGFLTPGAITSTAPALFQDVVDYGTTGYTTSDFSQLSAGAQKIITDGNAGGSSLLSEAFSYDLLYRCELAQLIKTENEIVYTSSTSKKTDFLVVIDGLRVGVSVTRAYVYPPTDPYTYAEATTLLQGKLSDIHSSTANVSAADAWQKQILHVLAYSADHVTAILTAYATIDAATAGDTILVVTETDGNDAFIY
jgi:hypothetical protein